MKKNPQNLILHGRLFEDDFKGSRRLVVDVLREKNAAYDRITKRNKRISKKFKKCAKFCIFIFCSKAASFQNPSVLMKLCALIRVQKSLADSAW
jgi:hypothetical protein